MVTIEKINEVHIRVSCDYGLRQELCEYFTFDVPGAKFMPSYRNKMWDGKIRLFSIKSGKIYLGLHTYVKEFCEERNYEIVYIENSKYGSIETKKIDRFLVEEFVQSVTNKIKARDYQIDAIKDIIENDRGLILSPTGSGKSFVVYVLVRYFLLKYADKKILIILPTTSLVEQLFTDFEYYGWNSAEHCHKIYHGKEKYDDKSVFISTWQSLVKQPESYFRQFNTVFVDECHGAKSKSIVDIMCKLRDCRHRIGLTGTLDGTKTHQLVLEGLFDRINQVTTTSHLMSKKQLSPLHIRVLVLQHSDADKRMMKGKTYQQEMEFLSTNIKRNQFIRSLVCATEGNILVLAQYIEKQLVPLCDMIVDHCGEKRTVHLIHGATPTDDREKVRQLVENDDNAVIVASYGTFSTGVNIKRIHAIVFASPYKSQVKILQSLGRGLRVAEDKEELELFDLADDLRYNNKENYTLKHLQERVKLYNKESFDYKIIPINLKQ